MKAYDVYTDDYSKIVFAENANKAKASVLHSDGFEDARYTEIRAKRIPEIDGLENEEPKDNLWMNEKVRRELCKKGWYCNEPDVYEKCADCPTNDVCDYYQDKLLEEKK